MKPFGRDIGAALPQCMPCWARISFPSRCSSAGISGQAQARPHGLRFPHNSLIAQVMRKAGTAGADDVRVPQSERLDTAAHGDRPHYGVQASISGTPQLRFGCQTTNHNRFF